MTKKWGASIVTIFVGMFAGFVLATSPVAPKGVATAIEPEALAGAPRNRCDGDCGAHCRDLCERCKRAGKDVGHWCSDTGEGHKACVGVTENDNDRCHDRDWLSACGTPSCEGGGPTATKAPVTFAFVNHSGQDLWVYYAVTSANSTDCRSLSGPVSLPRNAQWSSTNGEGQHGWYRFQTNNQGGCDSRFNKFESHTAWSGDHAGQTVPINVL